ncbi:hypothetical protein ACFLYF_03650 [Chloroflexota bacterium]
MGDSTTVPVLNSYHTIMIWLIEKPVIARVDDSPIHLEMETKPLHLLPKGEITLSLFIFTMEFLLEMMRQVTIRDPAL